MKYQKLLGWISTVAIAVVFGCLIGLGVRNAFTGVQAQSEKQIVMLAPTIESPLKIIDLQVVGQNQKFDQAFNAQQPNWVKNISFNVENISDKPIIYLTVNINFPETRSTGNMMSYRMSFGQHPNYKSKERKPMLLKPGETLEASLAGEKDKIDKFVNESQAIESIQTVELEIGFVIFADGTAWTAGTFMRQDPNNPKRYIPIKNEPPS